VRQLAIVGTVVFVAATLCSCRGRSVTFVPSSSVPSPIVLRDTRTFGDGKDRFAIMEALNESSEPVEAWIKFRFWDKAGQPRLVDSPLPFATTCSTLLSKGVLWPREKMPCQTLVPPDTATASYEVHIEEDRLVGPGRRTRTDMKVVGAELRSDRVDGWVENPKSSAICSVQVEVSFYDSSGRIVGWGHDWVSPDRIEPGKRAPFEVLTRGAPARVASFSATAWTLGSDCG
jgi:hypothetical protein